MVRYLRRWFGVNESEWLYHLNPYSPAPLALEQHLFGIFRYRYCISGDTTLKARRDGRKIEPP
jgi:hypothetical protein